MEYGPNPGHEHEMDRVLEHRVFKLAQTTADELDVLHYAAQEDNSSVDNVYRSWAFKLTSEAAAAGLVGSRIRLHSHNLHVPRIGSSSEADHSITIDWRVHRQHLPEEEILGLPPSMTGRFHGFHHAFMDNRYQLLASISPLNIRTSHYGNVTPHTWCPVQGAVFDLYPDNHNLHAESPLKILADKTSDLPDLYKDILDLDELAVRHKIGSAALGAEALHAIGSHGDALAGNSVLRNMPGLAEATIDLLSARMRLPRKLSFTTNSHRRLKPMSTDYTTIPGHTKFEDIKPRLAFSDHGELARLCFAAIHHTDSPSASPIVHVPLSEVKRVIGPQ